MSRLLRIITFVLAVALAPAGLATTLSPNFSDMWWNPAESGWGVNISQQGDVAFVTFFLYGASGQPVWYIGVLFLQGTNAAGVTTFAGDVFQSTGSWFATPWNAAAVTQRKAGSATLSGTTDAATLSYTIDGGSASKAIQRQTSRVNSIAGTYLGATSDITFNCANPARNNLRTDDVGAITIVQTADQVTIFAPTCTLSGTYVQQGQTGRIVNGSYTCTTNAIGEIAFSDLYVEQSGIVGKYVGADTSCHFRGTIGGARKQ